MINLEIDIKSKRGWLKAYDFQIPAGALLRCSDVSADYVGTWPVGSARPCDCARCEVWTGCDVSGCPEVSPHDHQAPTRYTLIREFPQNTQPNRVVPNRVVQASTKGGYGPRLSWDVPKPLGMPAASAALAVKPMMPLVEDVARGLFRVRMRDLIELRGEVAHCHKAYEWAQRIRAESVLWEKEVLVREECIVQAVALVEEMERWQHVVSANGLIASQESKPIADVVLWSVCDRCGYKNGRHDPACSEYDEFADPDESIKFPG